MDERFPPPSRPRPVKGGGVRVRAARGDIGSKWWSRKWVQALERFAVSSRLERGRRYARAGQVAKLDITTDGVKSKVQGSRARPYGVTIRLRALDAKEWGLVLDAMGARARFAASLLAGDVPHDIEEAFQQSGRSLFPSGENDLSTDCSCPDWENPCKHVAAVHYVLAEAFDADPFLLFTLRGRTREELLGALRARRVEPDASPTPVGIVQEPVAVAAPERQRPFWGNSGSGAAPISVSIAAPSEEASLLRALGLPPVWTSSQADPHGVVEVYRRATDWGLKLAFGEDDERPPVPGRRVATRTVASDGRVNSRGYDWYVGRDAAGGKVDLLEGVKGRLFARLSDGSMRRLQRPAVFEQMPPEG